MAFRVQHWVPLSIIRRLPHHRIYWFPTWEASGPHFTVNALSDQTTARIIEFSTNTSANNYIAVTQSYDYWLNVLRRLPPSNLKIVRENYLLLFPVTCTRPSFTCFIFMTLQDIYMLNYIFHKFLFKINLIIIEAFTLTSKHLVALRKQEQLFSLSWRHRRVEVRLCPK